MAVVARAQARIVTIALASGLLVGMTGTVAAAANVYGVWDNFRDYGGYEYSHRPYASNSGAKPAGGLTTKGSPTPPAGWIGASAYLYRYGSLCTSATPVYTSVSATVITRSASKDCGAGSYQGRGYGYGYIGTTYFADQSGYSPAVVW